MEPWHKVAIPQKKAKEGSSFNPDEFAIHLERVVAKTAPEDYRDPSQFFAPTCFTRSVREHAAMPLPASGRTNALRALLKAEIDRGPDFLRLANALYALYPKDSEGKRLLDAMLLAVPR
ncbi:MAG: hypothetical protein QME78_08625 [Thermodesulfobacteriota bacterium]|nr:hypothetical protein [Thermodesulfobacteriota bacterium]